MQYVRTQYMRAQLLKSTEQSKSRTQPLPPAAILLYPTKEKWWPEEGAQYKTRPILHTWQHTSSPMYIHTLCMCIPYIHMYTKIYIHNNIIILYYTVCMYTRIHTYVHAYQQTYYYTCMCTVLHYTQHVHMSMYKCFHKW